MPSLLCARTRLGRSVIEIVVGNREIGGEEWIWLG
jgi:hypothetical protein